MSQVISAPLAEGKTIPFRADHAVIVLQCVRQDAAYTVTVNHPGFGGPRVSELCSSHATETAARNAARALAKLFKTGATVAQVLDWLNPTPLARLAAIGTPTGLNVRAAGFRVRLSDHQYRILDLMARTGETVAVRRRGCTIATLKSWARDGLGEMVTGPRADGRPGVEPKGLVLNTVAWSAYRAEHTRRSAEAARASAIAALAA